MYHTFGGSPAVESPEPGEVIWRDDVAVTCRRWNWRQGRRPAADLLAELLSGPLAAASVGIERPA